MRDGWRTARIGDVTTTSSGATPKAGDRRYYTGGNVPFLKIGDLTDGLVVRAETLVTPSAVRDYRLQLLAPGTVLLAMYGSVGKTGILGAEATTNQAILALAADEEQVDPRFLHYSLLANQSEFVARSRGATQKNINKQIVQDFYISLPPLDEQARIVDLLDAITRATDAARREVSAAASLIAVVRRGFFSDPGSVRVALRDAVEVTMGRQRAPKYQTGDHMVPYLRAANIKDGFLVLDDVLSMNFTPTEQAKFALRLGDVMVTEGCGSLNQIGANAVWNEEIRGVVCFQNTLLRLRARDGVTTPSFVAHWARFAFESGAFARVASGTNIFHVGAERAAEMPFPLVELERQGEIAAVLDDADQAVTAAQLRVVALERLRTATLAAVLAGSHAIPELYDRFLTDENLAGATLEPATV